MTMKESKSIKKSNRAFKYGIAPRYISIIAFLTLGAQLFGYMEAELLNTYIDHVLNLQPIFIAIMVSSSAVMGLIFLFVFGIFSDNTRSRFGRRRPYLLVGGVVAGVGLFLFGFSGNYLFCYLIDVVIIGIASNSFYAAQRSLVPDLVEVQYRGRVNSILSIMSVIGLIFPVVLTLLANEFFTIPDPESTTGGVLLTQFGHQILLSIGGGTIVVCGLIGFFFLKNSVSAGNLPPKKNFGTELRDTFNFSELKKHKEVFKLIIANTLYMAGVNAVMSYLFNFLFSLGLETTDLIIMLAIAAPGLFIAIMVLGRLTDKIGRKKIIPPTLIISSIGFFLVPFITGGTQINTVLFGLVLALILVGLIGVTVPLNTWTQDLLPEHKRGQFLGIFNIVNTVSQIIGSMSAGVVATLLTGIVARPYAWIFAIVPIFFLASLPIFLKVKETLKPKITTLGEIKRDGENLEDNQPSNS